MPMEGSEAHLKVLSKNANGVRGTLEAQNLEALLTSHAIIALRQT